MSGDYSDLKDHHKAIKLRADWKSAGDKPCEHPSFMKEVLYGQPTGDEYCLTCGFNRVR